MTRLIESLTEVFNENLAQYIALLSGDADDHLTAARASPSVANDVVERLQMLSETDMRELVRGHALSLVRTLYHPVQDGRAKADPKTWIVNAIMADPCLQRCLVARGTTFTEEEVMSLAPAARVKACAEVIDFMRCVTSDEYISRIVLDEARPFIPNL